MVQSAIVILKESDKMPKKKGVLTPAAAFTKTTLMERIQQSGIETELVEEAV